VTDVDRIQPARTRRRWRVVDGIVLLDKPTGLSSTQALQRVRHLLQAEKAGHAGTLDPMATGMLPLCFGHATKACGALLGKRKSYRATVALGTSTDTGDAEGQPIAEASVPVLDAAAITQVLHSLTGERLQVPPMYSALKREGQPLYQLARRGEQVERTARPVTIEILELRASSDRTLDIDVVCSKGTYVRVLAEEIAAGLGTQGHLSSLRRLWVEPFEHLQMVTLDRIEADLAGAQGATNDWLRSVDSAFPELDPVRLTATQALHLRQGKVLGPVPDLPAGATLRAYDGDGAFLGLVDIGTDQCLRVRRLFVAGAG
jgi:tRNA pseudouridine55 synthase